jgi:hypothetical protein
MEGLSDKQIVALMEIDAWLWAYKSGVRLEGGRKFSPCGGHKFQCAPMQCRARHIVVMKAAQMTFTTIFMLRTLHGLIKGRYPQGVIYYFPTTRKVEEFSKQRFTPLIRDNPETIGCHLRQTDSVYVKRVNRSNLTLAGAKASQQIQGIKKDSASVRSTPADCVIRDERDLFDDAMAEQTKQRLLHSPLQEEVDLGTPTTPGYGIHKQYERTNQFRWFMRCEGCGEWTCAEREFPQIIHLRAGKGYLGCPKCGKRLDKNAGEWVAAHPDRWSDKQPEDGICGYWCSQLIGPYTNLRHVLERFEDPDTDKGEFYNAILGRPYISSENKLTVQDIYRRCGSETQQSWHRGPCAMGIDIGNVKHVTIGCRLSNGKAKVLLVRKTSEWSEIDRLFHDFNVKCCVIDAMPFTDSARDFQSKPGRSGKVFLCWYAAGQQHDALWDYANGKVSVNRTECFDESHRWLTSANLILPAICNDVEELAQHCSNVAKIKDVNERTGQVKYVWDNRYGEDHYRHALHYLKLALRRVGEVPEGGPRWGLSAVNTETADNKYDRFAVARSSR